jgi:hypothetical protein
MRVRMRARVCVCVCVHVRVLVEALRTTVSSQCNAAHHSTTQCNAVRRNGSTEEGPVWLQSALVCGTVVKLGRGSWIPAVCEVNYVQSGTTTFLMVSLCRSAGRGVRCSGRILLGRRGRAAAGAPAVPMRTCLAIRRDHRRLRYARTWNAR